MNTASVSKTARRLISVCALVACTAAVHADWRWVPVSPWPTGFPLAASATDGSMVVAVGPRSAPLFSQDGIAWSAGTAPFFGDLRDVATHPGRGFVAVGDGGLVLASSDGRSWAQLASPGEDDLVAVACTTDLIVIAASGGTVAYSDDAGASWRSATVPEATELVGLATDGEAWVVVGNGVWRSDDSETWTRVDEDGWARPISEDPLPFQDVLAAGSGLALLSNLGLLLSQDGGWSWTFETVPQLDLVSPRKDWESPWRLASGNGILVVTAGDPRSVCGFPTDQLIAVRQGSGEWESLFSSGPGSSQMLALRGWWIALPQWYGMRPLLGTTDFTTWTPLTSELPLDPLVSTCPNGNSVVDTASNGEELMICTYYGSYCRLTRDLVNWGKKAHGPIDELSALEFFEGRWVLSNETGTLWESPDGTDWSPITVPGLESPLWIDLEVGSGKLLAVGRDGDRSAVATTTDLVHWQVRTEEDAPFFRAKAVPDHPTGPAGFVALAWKGIAAHSTDGLTWTREVIPGSPALFDIAAAGGAFQTVVAITREGTVAYKDLFHGWRTTSLGETYLSSISNVDGDFIIGVTPDRILESSDGAAWSERPGPVGSVISALAHGPQTVIVGSQGAIAARVLGPGYPRVATETYLSVPVTAATDGLNGTQWSSDLHLANLEERWTTLTVTVDHLWPGLRTVLAPQAATTIADVVRAAGADAPGLYRVSINASGGIAAVSTISTPLAEGGMSQTVPALAWNELESNPGPVLLPFLRETAAYRTNIGLYRDNGQPIGATLAIRDASGTELGSRSLPPPGGREVTQYTQPTRWFTADPVAPGYAFVELAPDGFPTWTAWTSVVDNVTGDATFHLAQEPTEDPFVIAAVAHIAGASGTLWRTDLSVVNPGDADAQVLITPLPAATWTGTTTPALVTVAAGTSRLFEDVADALWNARGAAALLIEPQTGTVATSSRTYTVAPGGGSFGQGVPPLPLPQLGGRLTRIPGLREDRDHRTNLGLVNPDGEPAEVTVTLRHGTGQVLAQLEVSVPAHSLLQINRPLADLAETEAEGTAEVSVSTLGAAIIAWASVVDNHTGDAVFIPAGGEGI